MFHRDNIKNIKTLNKTKIRSTKQKLPASVLSAVGVTGMDPKSMSPLCSDPKHPFQVPLPRSVPYFSPSGQRTKEQVKFSFL